MTRDDIIRMARESGIELYGLGRDRENFLCILESFTKLVAAAERDRACRIVTGLCISDNNAHEINTKIREGNP
jgi:hypothetical protein